MRFLVGFAPVFLLGEIRCDDETPSIATRRVTTVSGVAAALPSMITGSGHRRLGILCSGRKSVAQRSLLVPPPGADPAERTQGAGRDFSPPEEGLQLCGHIHSAAFLQRRAGLSWRC